MCFLDSGMSVGIDPDVDVWSQRSGSKEDSWALALLTLCVYTSAFVIINLRLSSTACLCLVLPSPPTGHSR